MSTSLQYIRTDKAIVKAFMELLQEKPFEKITIQDILDATPVTRSTFYKHFHDKYEIAEKLQEHFLNMQYNMRRDIQSAPTSAQLQHSFRANQSLLSVLLNIHTEKVDIRKAIAQQSEEYYLSHCDSNNPTRKIEAQIFSHAVAAFQIANDYPADFSYEYMNNLFISAFLMLLGLPNDEDIPKLIHKKLAEKNKVSNETT